MIRLLKKNFKKIRNQVLKCRKTTEYHFKSLKGIDFQLFK